MSQTDRYTKNNQFYREVSSALGNGRLTSGDEVWQRQRRFLAPMFTARDAAESEDRLTDDEV